MKAMTLLRFLLVILFAIAYVCVAYVCLELPLNTQPFWISIGLVSLALILLVEFVRYIVQRQFNNEMRNDGFDTSRQG
jgi:membrane protein YdbS with pleckstrin-like domain